MVANGVASSMLLTRAAGSAGAQLRIGSASRWNLIRNEVHARYGWWPEITSSVDGFRPIAVQERLFRERYTIIPLAGRPKKVWNGQTWWLRPGMAAAAVPGTSNHGLGTTGDVVNVGGLNNFTATRYVQFADVATEFGFSNAEGRSIGEPWHWSDTQNPDIPVGPAPPVTTTTPEDDDMPLTATDLDLIEQRVAKTTLENVIRGPEFKGMISDLLNKQLVSDIIRGPEFRAAIGDIVHSQVAGIGTPSGPSLAGLSDADVARIAKAVSDEQSKRMAS